MFSGSPSTLRTALHFALLVMLAMPSEADAQVPKGPLRCAVEGEDRIIASKQLCEGLAAALQRQIVRVVDARERKDGDAIQIVGGDVQWIVAWLRDGQVRAWTRVSKTLAQGKELETIARATRALFAQRLGAKERCVRVDPNAGRRMRGFDLAYPWTELKACSQRVTEVADPWWRDD